MIYFFCKICFISYEKSRLDDITERSALKVSREEGRAEGRAEERAKAHSEKLNMALKMKSDGMPIDLIIKYTGLNAEEIAKKNIIIYCCPRKIQNACLPPTANAMLRVTARFARYIPTGYADSCHIAKQLIKYGYPEGI